MTLLDEAHPDEIERSLYEVDHVGRAFDAIDSSTGHDRFDVVHDHCGFTGLAMANRIDTPLVHTLHGPFTPETAAFYARHGHKGTLVGISRAQLSSAPPGLGPIASIPNPIDLSGLAAAGAQGRLPVVGRTDDPGKGSAPRDRSRARR